MKEFFSIEVLISCDILLFYVLIFIIYVLYFLIPLTFLRLFNKVFSFMLTQIFPNFFPYLRLLFI